jgi:predicted dehydrogenase
MPNKAYRVGVVGCSTMGGIHTEHYDENDRTEVVAASDLSESAATSFASEYDVDATYTDHAAMLEAEALDVVSVCTWHSSHAQIAIDAAEAGVDGILCEKPMATSWGETEDMLDAADRNDVKLVVGHQRRFGPGNEEIKSLVESGAIGEPTNVIARNRDGLLNMGTHLVDATRYYLDDPDTAWVVGQVERKTDRHERQVPIEDRCLGHVCFEGGTRLTYESDLPNPDLEDATLRLTGTAGVIDHDYGSSFTLTNADGSQEISPEKAGTKHSRLVTEFVEWLDGDRDDHRCSGERAAATMEVMMGLYESARTRAVVEPPLQTRDNPLELMIESGDLPLEYPGEYDIRIPYRSLE